MRNYVTPMNERPRKSMKLLKSRSGGPPVTYMYMCMYTRARDAHGRFTSSRACVMAGPPCTLWLTSCNLGARF